MKTKSITSDIEINNVVPIYEGDSVVMWAVNLSKGGYVICSAKKSYYPIIADVQYGQYNPEAIKDSAQEFYLDNIAKDIMSNSSENTNSEIESQWLRYENRGDIAANTKTTSDYVDDAFYEYLYDYYYYNWINQGYNVYFLRQCPEGMPDDRYESFCRTAADVLMDVPGYPYMECCMILEKITPYVERVGPLLQTSWHQNDPYNNSDPENRSLGCVTVAVGQIMKYFMHPNTFLWNEMPASLPDTVDTSVLSDFLYQLRGDLWVTNSGGSEGWIASIYLSGHGYHTSYNNHSSANVYTALSFHHPVYMDGNEVGGSSGHAWVCDGFIDRREYREYYLMVPSIYHNIIDNFDCFAEYSEPSFSYTTFHMNWGWGGSNDGYYIFPNPNTNYSRDWKDLIVHPIYQ